ncbi:T9SS type A sorting domain-containing protein [Pontibacter pamirensis]|uniref:T9SS type A sorting domain-containing protein n=1 Tax=Pontibacter pamirensis TaxID=2562824 RepID=UPI00138A2756|nr:T9SS type A sorting domain-containing protein [Pontibacter pamirensis]
MKKLLALFLTVFVFCNIAYSQVAGSFEIYILPYRFDTQSMTYFKNNGFDTNTTRIMTEGSIVYSGDKTNYDPAKVKNFLLKSYPDANSSGMLTLDWESGPYYDLRNYPSTDSRFKAAEAKLIGLVNEVRKHRPNLKLSYYSIPYRFYYDSQNTNWNPSGKYDNLLSKLDFIAPSLYILFADEETSHTKNLEYIRKNLDVALTYGKRLNKPVIPYVWHKVHAQSKLYGSEIIQKEVYAKYLKYIYNYSYNSYKAKGLYLWDGIERRLDDLSGVNNHLSGTVYDAATYDAWVVSMAKTVKSALNSGTTTTEPAPAPSPTTQQVVSFTLFDASTKKDIQTIANGATLNLATLPTKNFNIRANTNPGTVGSVKFALSGTQSKSVTESAASYDLMGDNGSWTPSVGSYTLKATPYTASKGTGTAGTALSVGFKVVNETSTTQKVVSFTLFDASTKKDILTIANGATLNLATLPTKYLNIRANTNPGTVGSVVFALSGTQSKSATESTASYDLMGSGSWTPLVGSYTLKATPYTASKGTGTAGTSLTIGFKVINQLTSSSTSAMSVSGDSATSAALGAKLVLYPNPASNLVNVELREAGDGDAVVNLYSMSGSVLMTQKETATGLMKTVLDVSKLQQGLYIIEVITSNGRATQRFVKE